MRNNLWFASLLGVIIFLLSGQAWALETNSRASEKISYSFGISLEVSYLMLNIPDQLQTVKADPDDSTTGSTTTNLDDSYGFGCKLNSRIYFYTHDELSFYAGGDLGFVLSVRDYRTGIYDTTSSNYGGESYAFTQLVPFFLTGSPLVGIQIGILDFQASFPYTGFELRNGNDRYGHWEEENNYLWQGFGQRYTLALMLDEYSAGLFYETFPAKFDGQSAQINSIGLFMSYYMLF